ncbi:ThiF family adenylyltransferase [Cellulomonas sp. DKR-3]|uniref:ThiF family adenylyltransferase n=1 Tax=Cellulomonas fulva TaxID=2835530 RepID=A0ABS5TZA4_9CELL|nr:ThiF family adenylyltransferase [Cellulomonas fulva]MBT0994477.1 ThiF family adenylyltransferase [Cellulomonas fulva]
MRLRRGLRVLPRGPGEVQVGTDPRWAVRVTDLTDDEVAALLALPPGVSLGALAGDDRLSPTRLSALIKDLDEARLLEPRDRSRALTGPREADAAVLGLILPDGDGTAVVAARARRAVGVVGLGPTGLGVAGVLAAGGVGVLRLEDARPVRSSDIGPSGYRWADVGGTRAEVAARLVAEIAPEVAAAPVLEGDEGARVDLLVVVAERALDPTITAALLSVGTPHLLVLVREADTVVGPLVVPGDGPCARCLDLHRTDADPHWPAVATALAAAGPAGRPPTGEVAPPAEPHAVAAVAAGIAGSAALAALDAITPAASADDVRGATPTRPYRPLRGTTLEIALPDARPHERRWAAHPSCGCAALRPAAAQPSGLPA